jgi:hypothetical protein
MSACTITSRFLLGIYLSVFSTTLVPFGQSAQAQSYPCSDVALGTNTIEVDQGYQQNNIESFNQIDIQSQQQSLSQQNNQMNTLSSTSSGSTSQQLNNSGSSTSGNTFTNASSSSSSRSNGQSYGGGVEYAGVGVNGKYSTTNSSSNSNSQLNSGSNSGSSEYDRNQNYQNQSNSDYSVDGSRINQTSANSSTYSNQSSTGSVDHSRRQNNYTKTGTTVVGMNCDRAVQAESERDREMIRQRGAVEQERLRQQRDQMRQRSSDDYMNKPW